MFENFTNSAKKVLDLAEEEARVLKHKDVGTGHILIGLVRIAENVISKVFENLGIDLPKARSELEKIYAPGSEILPIGRHLHLTVKAEEILKRSALVSFLLRSGKVEPIHILNALLLYGSGDGIKILQNLGCDSETIKSEIARLNKQKREHHRAA